MHRQVALCVSALVLVTGCGGAARQGAGVSSDTAADTAADTAGAAVAPQAAARDEARACGAPAECQRDCEAGQVHACTRWGDLLYPEAPARAEALWLDACERRDGVACVRRMALAAAEPRVADEHARKACDYGVGSACLLLGAILWGSSHLDDAGEYVELLRDAARVFENGCGHGHYPSCIGWAILGQDPALAGEPNHGMARAVELSAGACEAGDRDACLLSGTTLEARGALDQAKEVYARGCRLLIERPPRRPHAAAMRAPHCVRAVELGVAPAESSEQSSAGKPPPPIPERIAGSPSIPPSMPVKVWMQRDGVSQIKAVVELCVSRSGLVEGLRLLESSGYVRYDLELLEAMRAWRYRPYVIDGRAVRVCHPNTFVYHQLPGATGTI